MSSPKVFVLGLSFILLLSSCGQARNTAESTVEVLQIVNLAMRDIPVEDHISEIVSNGVPWNNINLLCPSANTYGNTLIVTAESPVSHEGNLTRVDARSQTLIIMGSCDPDGDGADKGVDGGIIIEKTLGQGAEPSRAHIEMDIGPKGPTCAVDLSVVFDSATGLATEVTGTFCKRPVEAFDLEWVIPGFGGEESLE